MEFFTIGVYNSTEKEFFDKILDNKIDLFCDIRQRRGVRGKKYSFVNSTQLQNKLGRIGVSYLYVKELSPTTNIRDLQKQVDMETGIAKSKRQELGSVFVSEYKNKVLANFDFDKFFREIGNQTSRVLLFCVEEFPEACHRSIVTKELANRFGYKITHF
jgi:uncharacterized protein (DUF488 family)